MKKLSILLLALVAGALAVWYVPLQAAVRPPKLQYQRLVLPNGLVVILHQDKSTPIVHVELWYHVGSKNERPGRTGFAHFFEHMMFKGSRNVEPEQHTSIVASVGGQANAYTNEDTTVFWQTIPAQYLPLVLWMEADRMASLRIDEKTFVAEREVVKEERRMRIENPPYGLLNELISFHAYDVHPYKHPVIGSMTDLNAATIADVREFYSTYYVPENATLMIVGDFDTDTAIELVNRHFGQVPKAAKPVPRDIPQEPQHTKERRVTVEQPWPLPAVVVTYQVPYNGHPDSYPMFVMSKTLSDGNTARIYRKLVYETGLALTAFGSSSFLEQPGIFSAVALVNPGKSPDEVEKALVAEFDKLKDGITERELQRAKNQFARDYILSRLSIKEKASQLGHAEVIQKDMATADGEFDTFLAVSQDDVKRVARKYFVPEGRMIMRVMPRGGARQ
ncbi:MAG TPA: pitrilysin family protein [Vicinamibacterales bacterium]|nr:pitrilysin family protein [Vicinamibacterales bacterium]